MLHVRAASQILTFVCLADVSGVTARRVQPVEGLKHDLSRNFASDVGASSNKNPAPKIASALMQDSMKLEKPAPQETLFLDLVQAFLVDVHLMRLMALGFGIVLLVSGAYYMLDSRIYPKSSKGKPDPARQRHIVDGQVVYEWSQTPNMVTIYMSPPTALTKKELDIKISSKLLRVGRKGKPCFLKADTFGTVNKEASRWALPSKGKLEIYLRKEISEEWLVPLNIRKKDAGTSHEAPATEVEQGRPTH